MKPTTTPKGFHGGEVYKPGQPPRSATQKRLMHAEATGHVTEILPGGLHRCSDCGATFTDDSKVRQ